MACPGVWRLRKFIARLACQLALEESALCDSVLFPHAHFYAILYWRARYEYLQTVPAAEGALAARLLDGSLRMLRIDWLLRQPADYVLPRRQDLPDHAFFAPADAPLASASWAGVLPRGFSGAGGAPVSSSSCAISVCPLLAAA